jgi:hypothetical protein
LLSLSQIGVSAFLTLLGKFYNKMFAPFRGANPYSTKQD